MGHSYSKTKVLLMRMGCLFSKGGQDESINEDHIQKESNKNNNNKETVQLIAPAPSLNEDIFVARGGNGGSVRLASKAKLGSVHFPVDDRAAGKKSLIAETPGGAEGELIAAGWPSWLASVAGEAVKGWLPRRIDSYDKLEKVISPHCLLFATKFYHLNVKINRFHTDI